MEPAAAAASANTAVRRLIEGDVMDLSPVEGREFEPGACGPTPDRNFLEMREPTLCKDVTICARGHWDFQLCHIGMERIQKQLGEVEIH
jgi:hypothetical protein